MKPWSSASTAGKSGEASPLTAGDGSILTVDPAVEARPDRATQQLAQVARCGSSRESAGGVEGSDNVGWQHHASFRRAAAKAGVTTGEWAGVMRQVHGEYRGPTGVSKSPSNRTEGLETIREAVDLVSSRSDGGSSFLSANRGWTATPTAPNR
jgi:(2R)-ethylmalonyl-CoA mutase